MSSLTLSFVLWDFFWVIYVLTLSLTLVCSYVDSYYLTSRWKDTYENNIKPVNGERLWEKTGKEAIQIPEKRRMPGRPKNYDRIKEAHESKTNPTKDTREGRRMTCSNCKQTCHNCELILYKLLLNFLNAKEDDQKRPRLVTSWFAYVKLVYWCVC